MKNRSNFLFALGVAMLMMIVLQWVFPPPKPPVAEDGIDGAAVAQLDAEAEAQAADDGGAVEDAEEQPAATIARKGIDSSIEFPNTNEILEIVKGDSADSQDINAFLQQRSLTSVQKMGDLITIGSLYETGTDRYLITLNPLGGTVRRIELNVRDPGTGRYKYCDLVWKGGYIGSLEAHDTAPGVRVGVVGPGTPADMATAPGVNGGIKAGDLLIDLNGESITDADEFGRMMAKTRPDDVVTVKVDRGGTMMTFSTTLTQKPIELIRPEPGLSLIHI